MSLSSSLAGLALSDLEDDEVTHSIPYKLGLFINQGAEVVKGSGNG